MKPFLRGALAAAAVCAAVLVLPAGEARADNECGTPTGLSFTGTCSSTTFPEGIKYVAQRRAFTLTVPGVSGSTTTITNGATTGIASGIYLQNSHQPSLGNLVQNIVLTVGGTGNINFVQTGTAANEWHTNRGILVLQRVGLGSTTTVDVRSGVTIGSATAKMLSRGIAIQRSVLFTPPTDGGLAKLTSAATIYSVDDGIYVEQPGTGGIEVTNSGAITTDARGIHVHDEGSAGAVTVINSGAITSAGTTTGGGIFARTTGKDAAGADAGVSIAHSTGAIAATSGGVGVRAHVGAARQEADSAHDDYVAPMNAGLAKISVTGGSIDAKGGAVQAINYEAGSVEIAVSAGVALTSTHGHGIEARLTDVGNASGTVAIASAGAIKAGTTATGHGIVAGRAAGSGDIEVTNSGDIEASGDAISAMASGGGGDISVTNSGDLGAADARVRRGIFVAHEGVAAVGAAGDISIANSGDIVGGPGGNDRGRLVAGGVADAIGLVREADASAAVRFGQAAGVEAGALSWRDLATEAAKGDDPGEFADAAAVSALFDSGADAATRARAAAIVARFRAALANEELDTVPGAAAIDTDGATGLSDDEIETYLSVDDDDRRALLRNVLAQSLSEAETAVLEAATTGGDVDGALDNADAGFSDDYKMAVKDLLKRFNAGNIRIDLNDGSINSRGDGVRAWYATPHDSNGRIDVTVAEGATVAGGMAGVWAANAGMGEIAGDSPLGRDLYLARDATLTLRQQFVTVHGTVTGGTDAAVHLSGGGALIVGEKGKVHAGSSGRAILVNDPGRSEIVIHGEVRGGAGAPAAVDVTGGGTVTVGLTGRVMANGAMRAIRANKATSDDTRTTRVVLHVVGNTEVDGGVSREAADAALARVQGDFGGQGVANNRVVFVPTDDDGPTAEVVTVALPAGGGRPDTSDLKSEKPQPPMTMPEKEEEDDEEEDERRPQPAMKEEEQDRPRPPMPQRSFDCDMAELTDDRCRLYEALPSVLLAMNGLPTYEERLAAARSEAGGWARVETARGEWEADSSTRKGVAYDRARSGVRVGVDAAVGETGRVGVSAHGLRGSADMTRNGGKVELSGVGASVSGTAVVGAGVYIDAQAAATRYDVKLTSKTGTVLKDGAAGMGYALAVEAGRPVALTDSVTLTPRAGFVWSRVSLNDFVDSRSSRLTVVSMEDAESLTGRAGVRAEVAPGGAGDLRMFGSAEATHEFSGDTETRVAGMSLKASPETTGARFALGVAHGWGEGRFALQASAAYATGGSGGDGFGGGLSLSMRF